MKTQIIIEIDNCEECPFHTTKKVYTADSWDDCRKVSCSRLRNKVVHSFLDWNEKSTVPACCPFKKKNENQSKHRQKNQRCCS